MIGANILKHDFPKQDQSFQKSKQRAEELEAISQPSVPSLLQRRVPKPKPFPFELLGLILGNAAKRMHEIIQAPDSTCGQSVLAATALAAQSHADVEIDGRRYPISISAITVGESGGRKSEVDKISLEPIRIWQKMLCCQYQSDFQKYKSEIESRNLKIKAISSNRSNSNNVDTALRELGEEPQPPMKPIIVVEEPTYEGLVKLFAVSQPSLGLFSDEGGRLFGGYGMQADNLLKTASGLSNMIDGKEISQCRAGDGSLILYGRRLSLHVMIQPIVFNQIASNPILRHQGLLNRCLIAFPESLIGMRKYQSIDTPRDPEILGYYRALNALIDRPTSQDFLMGCNTRSLPLSGSSKNLWIDFHDSNETSLLKEYREIAGFGSKAPGLVLRISGALTLMDNPLAEQVCEEHIEKAVDLVKWYQEEFFRTICDSSCNDRFELAQRVLEWALQKYGLRVPFSHSELINKGPNKVRNTDIAQDIMSVLMEHGYVERLRDVEIGGSRVKVGWVIVAAGK